MNRVIVQFAPEPEVYFWRGLSAGGDWLDPPSRGNIDALCVHLQAAGAEIWLLLPGDRVVCGTMAFSAKEKRHLGRLVPFQFEESVAADVDNMHFALAEPGDESVAVAYVERAWFSDCLQAFESRGVELHYCVPEPLVLAPTEAGWTLCYGEQVSVRYADNLGFAIEAALLTPALEGLLEHVEQPERLRLLADDRDALDTLQALVPADLEVEIETEVVDLWDSHNIRRNIDAAADSGGAGLSKRPINLRQGEFARRLPFEKWWLEWRNVAAVAGAAVVIYAGLNIGGYQALKGENLTLRQEIEAAYRTAVPRGRISDPEQQLRTKVRSLQGGNSSGSATLMISAVAPFIAGSSELTLQGMNYADQRGELRLSLEAKTFNAIEKLRVSLEQQGLQAELLSSNRQGEMLQARMRVKRKT